MSDQSVERRIEQIENTLNTVNVSLADVHHALTAVHEAVTTANTRLDTIAKITYWFIPVGVGILLTIVGTLRNWF
jgi:hypothetical protein